MSNSNLRLETSFDNNSRLHALLAKQAEIDAEIASLLPSSTASPSYHSRTPIHKQHQHRRKDIPRSMSSTGVTSMARHSSSNGLESIQQRRTLSQRSAPSMTRSSSARISSNRNGNVPFTQNGALPPTLNTESRREDLNLPAWQQDKPPSSYTFSQQQTQIPRKPDLDQVPELGHLVGGEDVSQFIYRTMGVSTPAVSLSPSMPDMANSNFNNNSNSYLASSYNIPTPSTPASDSLTTATTFTGSMSRQNSMCTVPEPLLESISMMKFQSNTSFSSDVHDDHVLYDQVAHFQSHSRRSSNEEQSQLLVGAGGASHESQFPHSLSMSSSTSFGERMEKSQSNESTSSSASSASRNVKRLQDQINVAAARPLMPKGGSDIAMSGENSSQLMARSESKEGSSEKVAISKPTYQRPKHDRVHCKQCDNHPEGFRGEHELRRHQDREHKTMVKKWVCVEPKDGHNRVKPVLPLTKCKACTTQQKKYGAYYNAAAHLRRAHFKPKSKGRSKSKGEDAEKRGGKGGGDWPPMSELKCWMKEVEEQVTDFAHSDTQQEAADLSEDESLDDEKIYSQHNMPTIHNNLNFDNTFIADNSPTLMYPGTVMNTNDIYGMQMSLDLSDAGQAQCMDQNMYTGPTQNNYPNFSHDFFPNDQMVLYDNSSMFPQF